MFEPLGKPRKLPYPLRSQISNENVTPENFEGDVFVWPEDTSERTIVPFLLSQDEWLALSSSIDVGADIAYPLQYIEVIRIWMRQTRYSVAICSLIIDCINNDADTRAAIVSALKQDADFNQYLEGEIYRLTEGQVTGRLVGGSCDNGVVAGRALQLVERLDTNNKDFLESVEVGTNDEERVSDIIGAIPAFETLPFDDIINVLQDFLEDFAENYEGISTIARREQMANEIYCLMKGNEDCSITFEQLFNYFNDKAFSGLNTLSTIFDVINFLYDGDFDNDDAIWYGMFALQISFVLVSRDFFGVGIGTIGSIMRDAPPSTIWEEWDPCEEPLAGFVVYGNVGTTTVVQEGNVYTVTGGFTGPLGNTYIYVGPSVDGTPASGVSLVYDNFVLSGVTSYDWGNEGGYYTSVPPTAAPPPNVYYAGGAKSGGPISSVSFVIETTLPYQGLIQGT